MEREEEVLHTGVIERERVIDELRKRFDERANVSVKKYLDRLAYSLRCDVAYLTPDSNFKEDLNVSKLEFTRIVMTLEHAYNVGILDKEFLEIETVGELYDYICKHITKGH